MKKIVSALALTAAAASLATAEVTVKINSRTRPSLYTSTETYADNSKDTKIMDFSNAAHSDDLAFTGKGENAGITAKLSLSNDKADYNVTGGQEGNGTGSTTSISLGEYYGWFTAGNFKLTGGNFDSRLVNRYNKSAVEEGLSDSDTAKWGLSNGLVTSLDKNTSAHKTVGKTFLYDFNNFVAVGGTRHVALVGDYTIGNVGDGSILIKAGAFANRYSTYGGDDASKWSWDDDDIYADDKSRIGAGFAGEVAYQSKAFTADVVFKKPTEHTMGIGGYVDIGAVENLNLALGFTYGSQSEYDYVKKDKDSYANNLSTDAEDDPTEVTARTYKKGTAYKWSAYAFDARAFYQINDPLLVGLQAKYSAYTSENGTGKKDLKATGIELVATAQYKVNDAIQTQMDFGYYNENMSGDIVHLSDETAYLDKNKVAVSYIKVRPAVKFTANSAAAVTCALEYQTALDGGDADDAKAPITKSSIKVPVIVRIKL